MWSSRPHPRYQKSEQNSRRLFYNIPFREGSVSHIETYLNIVINQQFKKKNKQNQQTNKQVWTEIPPTQNELPRIHVVLSKKIRPIWTHLRGEIRNRDTPTDRKECASDKCSLPSAKPIPWWRILQKPKQLPTLFSVPSSELQISQTQDLKRLQFKKKYCCPPFELPSVKAAVTPPGRPLKGLEESYPGLGAGADQQTAEKPTPQLLAKLQALQPYTDQLHLRFWGRCQRIWRAPATPPGIAAQEMNAACPTSSGLMLNFNLFGHLLSCY